MCKVAAVSKITNQNRENVWVFMQLLGELMSQGNSDGLGYAAFDSKGHIFGEKWLFNKSAFRDLSQIPNINADKMSKIYSFFGNKVLKNDAQAIILHTRMATCGKGINNVHPFVNDEENPESAIIHNGVIFNEQEFKRKYSSCDSEVLAHLYHENGVPNELKALDKFANQLMGWYTVLALSKDKSGRMILDAFSDSGRLGSYYIKELDTRIFSTSPDDVHKVATGLGLTAVDLQRMSSDTAFRIDVLTGEEIENIEISTKVSSKSSKNIVFEKGNFDDEEFVSRWFAKGSWRGH